MISPLLANLYLHWFDKIFNGANGPRRWANARIVRYADDFVIMARNVESRIVDFTEYTFEERFGLRINREKTRCVDLVKPGESLSFLGFTYRYNKDLQGRGHRYLNIEPSTKSLQRERNSILELTAPEMCFKPVTDIIQEINRQSHGWANYFRYGYPRKAFRKMNMYIQCRLIVHMNRRSQRPMRPPKGVSYYKHSRNLGLVPL